MLYYVNYFQETLQGIKLLDEKHSRNRGTTEKILIKVTFYATLLCAALFLMHIELSNEKTFGHHQISDK